MPTVLKVCCQVEKIIDHGMHVYTVDLIPDRRIPAFKPGQFLHLALDSYDPSSFWPDSRVFSIASSPLQRDGLRIVYSVQGKFTARMEQELQVGGQVWVKLPYGEFIIEDSRPIVLFAGGTGISAFTAFLEGLTESFTHPIHVFYGARTPNLLIYAPLLKRLQERIPSFWAGYYVEQNTGIIPPALTPEEICVGRLSVDEAWKQIANPLAATYYLSGPPKMLESLSSGLRAHQVMPDAIRIDAW